jgi:lysophospholipase L1-like esterase
MPVASAEPDRAARSPRVRQPAFCLAAAAALFAAGCGSSNGPSPIPPTIMCPAAQTAESIDGSPVAVHFALPTVTGAAQPIGIACVPTSGSTFNVGATSVTCTARDARQQTASCAFTVTVVQPPKIGATRFVAFGDSITAGAREPCPGGTLSGEPLPWHMDNLYLRARARFVDVSAAYPTKLEALLAARYKAQSLAVRNEGATGECVSPVCSTPAGVQRLPGVLAADAPEVLLLQEGVNDVNSGRAAGAARVIDGLRTMIGNARGRGALVLLGTLLPERVHACRGYAPDVIPSANDQIRALAMSENVELVDLYAAFGADAPDTYIGPDGLHPTVAGYELMAQTFFEAIRKKLEVAATPSRFR